MQITVKGSQELQISGDLYEVEYRATADIFYQPAKVSGPPEDCYPAEGECNITSIVILDITGEDDNKDYTKDQSLVQKCLSALDQEDIEECLWESYHEDSYLPPSEKRRIKNDAFHNLAIILHKPLARRPPKAARPRLH